MSVFTQWIPAKATNQRLLFLQLKASLLAHTGLPLLVLRTGVLGLLNQ